MKRLVSLAAVFVLTVPIGPAARHESSVGSFRPVGKFMVPGRNSAEIVSATPDGKTLVYTDAIGATVGIVDITNPANPVQTATININGQPTSVAVTPDGKYAVVAVRRALYEEGQPVPQPFQAPAPGELWLISLQNPAAAPVIYPIAAGPGGSVGYLPDSVALARIRGQLYAVVALENEPIVLVTEDGTSFSYLAPEPAGVPRCPTVGSFVFDGDPFTGCDLSDAGFVQLVRVKTSGAPGFEFTSNIGFSSSAMAGLLYPGDPQPEFVAIRGLAAAVTLQENNGFAVLNLWNPASPEARVFDAGRVESRRADLTDNAEISFTETYPDDVLSEQPQAGLRVPDGIAWSANGGMIFTANEGELAYTGGRGWSGFVPWNGSLAFDDGGRLERTAVARSHYPDGRSDAKGIEPEGIATGLFDDEEFVLVTSERGNFVAVYRLHDGRPRFVQLLPTGIGPESVLAIPSRNLLVTADEGDDGDGSISIFKGVPGVWNGTPDRPVLQSSGVAEPWAALSGFAPDLWDNDRLFSVPDNAAPSAVYEIQIAGTQAQVKTRAPITKDGVQARYDLEGIANDTSIAAPGFGASMSEHGGSRSRGFWLAHEGNAACNVSSFSPNLLIQVNARGQWLQQIRLPEPIEPTVPCVRNAQGNLVRPAGAIGANGFEGVAVSPDGRSLLVAIQRPFTGEVPSTGATHTRIGRYDLRTGTWDFFAYPLHVNPAVTIGLSEIVVAGRTHQGEDIYAVIERDNQYGLPAAWKRIYVFTLPDQSCAAGTSVTACVAAGAVIAKFLGEDLLGEFFPLEKVEALAVTRRGDVWVALDNDGGEIEPRMVRIRRGR